MPPLNPFNRTCLALAIGHVVAFPAQAEMFTVTNDNDNGDGSLRKAITDANDNLEADDIVFGFTAGLSPHTITLVSDLPTITTPITISGPGADSLTVVGGIGIRGFAISGPDANNSSISHLTITGASLTGTYDGGAIQIESANNVTLSHLTLSGNSAGDDGGGIYAWDSDNLSVTNSTLSGNSAGDGGGILARNSDNLNITNSIVSGNSAGGWGGGGIAAVSSQNLNITNSTLSDNTAVARGGGIALSTSYTASVVNSTLSNNSANLGGGMYASNAHSLGLISGTITDNSTGGQAGGMMISGSYNLSVVNSIISGNRTVNYGGEIHFSGNSSFDLNTGNLFGDNGNTYSAAFHNVTLSTGNLIATLDNGASLTTLNKSLEQILHPLDDNGGPTLTHALVPNSPAIDAGDQAFCVSEGITTDQRGENRDKSCDIGAFEFIDDEACFVINGTDAKTIVFCL